MLKNCFILNSFFVSHTKKETKKSLRWGNDLIKLCNHLYPHLGNSQIAPTIIVFANHFLMRS